MGMSMEVQATALQTITIYKSLASLQGLPLRKNVRIFLRRIPWQFVRNAEARLSTTTNERANRKSR